jgi:hypothetical protein
VSKCNFTKPENLWDKLYRSSNPITSSKGSIEKSKQFKEYHTLTPAILREYGYDCEDGEAFEEKGVRLRFKDTKPYINNDYDEINVHLFQKEGIEIDPKMKHFMIKTEKKKESKKPKKESKS